MMRLLRIVVALIFIAVTVFFSRYYYFDVIGRDDTYPEIKLETDEIEVEPGVSEKELLSGVTAYDGKDGDLTDKVIVESISKFIEPGVCKISYAVCDSDNHVASVTGRIVYKDYVPPKFSLTRPLLFALGERINLSDIVSAEDVIDGDLKNSIIVTSADYKSGQQGVFHAEMKVSNSKGDIVRLRVPMLVEEKSSDSPIIVLSENIIYIHEGAEPDYKSFILSATDAEGAQVDISKAVIKSEVKISEEGAYAVHCYVTDSKGRQGHTVLTVVVES